MKVDKTNCLLAILIIGLFCIQAVAQTPPLTTQEEKKRAAAPKANPALIREGRRPTVSRNVAPVIVQNADVAPQIVTILHRLSGLKVMRLLRRSSEQVGAIANLDEAFKIATDVHTNVIAGLALDDGRTIVAWLPEAEAEIPPPPVPPAPELPMLPGVSTVTGQAPKGSRRPATAPKPSPAFSQFPFAGLLEPANLRVITRDGKRIAGRYVGLDGLTGLSVISLASPRSATTVSPKPETIALGQRIRVIGPQPASGLDSGNKGAIYVRLGQTEATVVNTNKSPSGEIARIRVRSAKFSTANIGGIAINDAGETVGIVDAVEGNDAMLVPVSVVRSAVKRVTARQASVPRPWLGVRGEPVAALTLEKMMGVGWQLERARELAEKNCGILLTSVVPGSPAALNKLKAGDVILTVNNEAIRNAEEFSMLLQHAGPGTSVHFTVASPGKIVAEAIEVELKESPDPLFGWRRSQGFAPKVAEPGSLLAQGIETIAIKPKVAVRFGATGGLLVIYVQPATSAFKAGLRPGDVIEAINGHQVESALPAGVWQKNSKGAVFNVVRNKHKLVLTIATSN